MISSKPAVVACQLDPRFRQLNFFELSDSITSQSWLKEEYEAELKRVAKQSAVPAPEQKPSTAPALSQSAASARTMPAKSTGKTATKQTTLAQSSAKSSGGGSGSGSTSNGKEEKKSTKEEQQKSDASAALKQSATALPSSGTKRKAESLPVTAKEKAEKRAKLLEQAARQFGDRAERIEVSNEIKEYMSMPSVPLDTDPLQWWRTHKHRFPVLARVARRFLCIPASSAPAERVWSTAGNTITEKRARLSDQSVENIILCH